MLVPEEDFPVLVEDGCEDEGSADEAVAEGQVFDNCIRPHGDPGEINQEGNDVDFESPADREKYIQKADKNEGSTHNHSGDTHLVIAPGVFLGLVALRLVTLAHVDRQRPGKDDEGARVLIGADGVIARKLPPLPGAVEPPQFYQIEFGFSFQQAEAVEIHFDLANHQESRAVLRMTREGSVLGYCDGDRAAFIPGKTTRPPQPFAKDVDGLHSVKLERQPGGWIASVDGADVGTLPLYHPQPLSEFRLRVEKGPAWLENFVLEELTGK